MKLVVEKLDEAEEALDAARKEAQGEYEKAEVNSSSNVVRTGMWRVRVPVENLNAFRKAVLVEFPQRGQWAIGLVVGAPGPAIDRHLHGEMLTVFVPTAPNPTSGYTIIVRVAEIKELGISVDEALKFIVSLGVVTPGGARPHRPAALTSEDPRALPGG